MRLNSKFLDAAIQIATNAHAGQRSFSGNPYILHPLRVMMQMTTDEEKIVAILHDVPEDTSVKVRDLERHDFPRSVIHALVAITRNQDEDYEVYIDRLKNNELARKVKIVDLHDNMQAARLPKFTDGAARRMKKYHTALQTLSQ